MKIFIGLGNPGLKYQDTRHNIGFRVIDEFVKKHKPVTVIKTEYCKGWEVTIEGKQAVLIKPKTFINESGLSVKKIWDRFDGPLEDYIIIHDDLDIEMGRIKIVSKKGAGGHNGIISVINELGSKDFVRIRIGIGRDIGDKSYIDYVLTPFLPEEQKLIESAVNLAVLACEEIVRSSVAKAMSLYNNG